VDRPSDAEFESDDVSARGADHQLTDGAQLGPAIELLAAHRDEILARWLEITGRQRFHRNRREVAVLDHLPDLIDALLAVLRRTRPSDSGEGFVDDSRVLEAAKAHAFVRFEQGLGAADIVTEIRLLRLELNRAVRMYLDRSLSSADVVAAELVVNDALDGATALSMSALSEKVDEVRSDFMATTLHDASQPGTVVRLSIQGADAALNLPTPDVVRARESLLRAQHSLDRMTVLLDRLAAASRLALGSVELRHSETGLGPLVDRVVADLAPDIAGRVQVASDDNDSGLWDSAALEQVVANLLSNAAKFAPGDTPIEVEIKGSDQEVELTVRDHGIGIDPADFDGVFRRFARTREAQDAGISGHGLGLYLSRGIIEAHGGRISADSAGPDAGSVFRVVLPRHPVTPDDQAATRG